MTMDPMMIQRMIAKSKNLAKNVGRSMEVVIARLTLAENTWIVIEYVGIARVLTNYLTGIDLSFTRFYSAFNGFGQA